MHADPARVYDTLPAVLPTVFGDSATGQPTADERLSARPPDARAQQAGRPARVAGLRRLVRGAGPGRELRPPDPAARLAPRPIDTTTGEVVVDVLAARMSRSG